MKDKLKEDEFRIYKFMLDIEKFIKMNIPACRRGNIFEN
jgi:hypothetical protein